MLVFRVSLNPYENTFIAPKFQVAGSILFCVSLLAAIVSAVVAMLNSVAVSRVFQIVVVSVLFLSVALMVFSAEKTEDESTKNARVKAVMTVVSLVLCLTVIVNLIQVMLPEGPYAAFKSWRQETFWNGSDIMMSALLYYVLFKLLKKRSQ